MERACKVVRSLRLPEEAISGEEVACIAWRDAVGPKVAAHTRAAKLVRTRLVVEVEDRLWQRQLLSLAPFILRNLARHVGSGLVEDLEFRVVPRRREPQRAQQSAPGRLFDEANAIEDPVLRSIYKVSRAKAQA